MDVVACVIPVDADLVERLDARLGPPLDSYVRGWQVWLEPQGPNGETLEWRLHPPAGFDMPQGVNPHDLFEVVLAGIAEAADPDVDLLDLGAEKRPLSGLWEVLEVFPTFGEEIGPSALIATVEDVLGRRPDRAGHVDHGRLGDLFKGHRGNFSVGQALLDALDAVDPPGPPR